MLTLKLTPPGTRRRKTGASGQSFTITAIQAEDGSSCISKTNRGSRQSFSVSVCLTRLYLSAEIRLASLSRVCRRPSVSDGAAMSFKATSGFIIILLSVKVIQGGNDFRVTCSPSEVCGIKGSTVSLYCYYNYPQNQNGRGTTFWVVGDQSVDLKTVPQYSDRVQYYYYEWGCSLKISDLRESDSAVYRMRFTTNQPNGEYISSPGVTLSVRGLHLQVKKRWYSRTTLECQNGCPPSGHVSYVWYRNGEIIPEQTSSTYSGSLSAVDSYSCAVKGHEQFASPPVCVWYETCHKVTYEDRNICVTRGSSVDISCSYSIVGSITSKLWFRRGEQWTSPSSSHSQGRVQVVDTGSGRSTLRITDVTESDSAEYHFKFRVGSFEWRSVLPGTTLTVTALQIEVIRVTSQQQHVEAELKCGSSCSPAARPSYVWFKNGDRLQGKRTSFYKALIEPGDEVSCSLERYENHRSPPVYAPKPPSVSATPSAEIEEGSSVTLNCSSDANPQANYTWYKKEEHRSPDPSSGTNQLVFASIQPSASGLYYCRAENQLGYKLSNYTLINVTYAPKTVSLSVRPSGKITEGSRVTLNCSSDANPAAVCTWYKENQTALQGPNSVYVFGRIRSEDDGNYRCKCTNQHGELNSTPVLIDVQYAPKTPSVSVRPSAELVEGSSVTLTCSSDANPQANYTWYKKDEESPLTSGQNFTIPNVGVEHSGYYYCEAQSAIGRSNSSLKLIAVAGLKTSAVVGSLAAIVLALVFISVFFLIRRKMCLKRTVEPPVTNTQLKMSSVCDDQQEDLCYASVRFINNQEDPLYLNIRPTQRDPHGENQEEDESHVEYSVITVKSSRSSLQSGHEAATEDLSALYSTVRK